MHNFVQPNVAQKFGLRVNHDRKFTVFTGNENSFLCECVYLNKIMESQGVKYKVDIFVLSLQGPHSVLGIPWLQKLRKVTHDYSYMTMELIDRVITP